MSSQKSSSSVSTRGGKKTIVRRVSRKHPEVTDIIERMKELNIEGIEKVNKQNMELYEKLIQKRMKDIAGRTSVYNMWHRIDGIDQAMQLKVKHRLISAQNAIGEMIGDFSITSEDVQKIKNAGKKIDDIFEKMWRDHRAYRGWNIKYVDEKYKEIKKEMKVIEMVFKGISAKRLSKEYLSDYVKPVKDYIGKRFRILKFTLELYEIKTFEESKKE